LRLGITLDIEEYKFLRHVEIKQKPAWSRSLWEANPSFWSRVIVGQTSFLLRFVNGKDSSHNFKVKFFFFGGDFNSHIVWDSANTCHTGGRSLWETIDGSDLSLLDDGSFTFHCVSYLLH